MFIAENLHTGQIRLSKYFMAILVFIKKSMSGTRLQKF